MNFVLKDSSVSALVESIEANRIEFAADLGRSPQIELHEGQEILWFISEIPFPGFNRVLHAQFEANDPSQKIGAALAPFRERGVPMMWQTGPSTKPADLGQRLTDHGLVRVEDEPGLAIDLLGLDDDVSMPSGVAIERVSDLDTLRDWMQTFSLAFGLSGGVRDAMLDVEASLGLGQDSGRRLYIGLLEGEPVATSLQFLGAGVAGIYGVGVAPKARRRGIGRVMTVAPLLEARAMGYRVGVLHASPMAVEIYMRLGFQEYFRVERYIWTGNG